MVYVQIGKATRNNKRTQSIKILIELGNNPKNTHAKKTDLMNESVVNVEGGKWFLVTAQLVFNSFDLQLNRKLL